MQVLKAIQIQLELYTIISVTYFQIKFKIVSKQKKLATKETGRYIININVKKKKTHIQSLGDTRGHLNFKLFKVMALSTLNLSFKNTIGKIQKNVDNKSLHHRKNPKTKLLKNYVAH